MKYVETFCNQIREFDQIEIITGFKGFIEKGVCSILECGFRNHLI